MPQVILVHAALLLVAVSELLKFLKQLWSRQERDGILKQVTKENLMEELVTEVWGRSKEANNGWCCTPGIATVGAMATPWSERTSAGSG